MAYLCPYRTVFYMLEGQRMLNKKIVKKIIIITLVIFVIWLLAISDKDFSRLDVFLIAFTFILLLSKSSKNKYLKDLPLEYENKYKLLKEIFKYCPDAVFLKDCESKYIYCNDAFLKIINKTSADVLHKTDASFLPSEMAKKTLMHDKLIIKNKEITNYDLVYDKSSEETQIFNIIKSPLIEYDKVVGILGIARDVTIEKALKSTIEEKQIQLGAILENMPFFVCMKDLDGKILRANKKSLELHGKEPQELIGLDSRDLFSTQISEQFLNDDKKVIENKESIKREVYMDTPFGPKWTELTKSPILDEDNNVQGIVIIHTDIDLVKEVEGQKETFVATLTHDLKVPTIAQIKALELLEKGFYGEGAKEQKEVLGQILNSCRYMLNMISTLLSTYCYDEGVKKINYEEFDFVALVSECCNEITCLAKEKEQKLIIKNELSQTLICADKLEIKRVITNLISNAISYSFKNSPIEISIQDSETEFIFFVNSHSNLIPSDQLEKLFDKYVSNSSKFRQTGIGLGLYLTKQIIAAHNGEAIAQSDEINGNTFGFKIPKKNLDDISVKQFSNDKESLEF